MVKVASIFASVRHPTIDRVRLRFFILLESFDGRVVHSLRDNHPVRLSSVWIDIPSNN